MSKVLFSRREFLNKPGFHTVGNIMIEFEDVRESGSYEPFYSSFYISNCDKSSHFQLDTDTVEGVDNSIHKLTKIIEVCDAAREQLKLMRPQVDEWRKKKDKEKKAKKKDSN